MSLYRIYIDEVGNHDMAHVDDPNQRYLSLTGIILEKDYQLRVVTPEFDALKRKYFQFDPDEPVIFHRKEIVNKKPPFHVLRDPLIEDSFNEDLLTKLKNWEYSVITVLIDKKAHQEQYAIWRFHPYHYCLTAMLERYVRFLQDSDATGDVMVEARGSAEDETLKKSYELLIANGTDHIPATLWKERITSGRLKVKPKSANICGLQLADLLAHPARRDYLLQRQLLIDKRNVFGDEVAAILRNSKYRRSELGKIEGYGQKFLP